MKPLVSVLINNYNYATYLPEAIESVLAQTYPHIEIIVVDDGSTDTSHDIMRAYQEKYPQRIVVHCKANGGQASAFNAGVALAQGEVVCFLDSDDAFEPQKVEEVVKAYEQGYAYMFNNHTMVFENGATKSHESIRFPYNGYNLFLVYYISKYVGDITSTLSLSKALAMKIFPIVDEKGWRIQADDVIVFSASMLERAYFIPQPLTRYRIHGTNGYYNKIIPADKKYERLKRIGVVKKRAVETLGLDEAFFHNTFSLVQEFKTHEHYDNELLKLYTRVLFLEMRIPFLKKVLAYKEVVQHYLKERKK
jgi:glycosyltransferase involved in cell wall biosynthesis